jgi:hypothetical protein
MRGSPTGRTRRALRLVPHAPGGFLRRAVPCNAMAGLTESCLARQEQQRVRRRLERPGGSRSDAKEPEQLDEP